MFVYRYVIQTQEFKINIVSKLLILCFLFMPVVTLSIALTKLQILKNTSFPLFILWTRTMKRKSSDFQLEDFPSSRFRVFGPRRPPGKASPASPPGSACRSAGLLTASVGLPSASLRLDTTAPRPLPLFPASPLVFLN